MKGVRVTALPGAYWVEGVSYGPFQASRERPFVEVPEVLANALGLPRYDGQEPAPEEATDAEMLVSVNHALKADLDRVTAEWDEAYNRITELERENAALSALLDTLKASTIQNTEAVNANTEALKQASLQQTTVDSAAPGIEAESAITTTPLPADFPMRALLVENGFDTVAKVRGGLEVPEGQKESPVQAIDGIGPKTIEAIRAALP